PAGPPHAAAGADQRGPDARAGSPHPRLERDARLLRRRQAGPDRGQDPGRRPQGPGGPPRRRGPGQVSAAMSARIKENYVKQIVPRLMKERNYPNVMAVPRLRKGVIDMGAGQDSQ